MTLYKNIAGDLLMINISRKGWWSIKYVHEPGTILHISGSGIDPNWYTLL